MSTSSNSFGNGLCAIDSISRLRSGIVMEVVDLFFWNETIVMELWRYDVLAMSIVLQENYFFATSCGSSLALLIAPRTTHLRSLTSTLGGSLVASRASRYACS